MEASVQAGYGPQNIGFAGPQSFVNYQTLAHAAFTSANPPRAKRPAPGAQPSQRPGHVKSNSQASSKNLSVRLPKSSRISGEPSDVGFGAQHFEVQPGALTTHPQSIVPPNAQLRINFPKVIAEASNSTTFGGTALTTELNQTMRRVNQNQRPSLALAGQEPGTMDPSQHQASMIKYTHL